MVLMRVQIDKRTIAGIGSLGTATYAHGLGGVPDGVLIRYIASNGSSTSWYDINAVVDATNVSLRNPGNAGGPNFEVCTLRYHSLIQ